MVHQGNKCHRGTNPHKKASFHPSQTTKRCIYQTDGSGRDSYILNNNGGLCASRVSQVNGTDLATVYGNSLRGYSKDSFIPGFNRGGATLRMTDKFIASSLADEHPEFSTKYAKQLQRVMEKEGRSPLSKQLDTSDFQSPRGSESYRSSNH